MILDKKHQEIHLFTDGCAKANGKGGPGGWAALVYLENEIIFLGGYSPSCTNNQMEMLGAIRGIEAALPFREKIKLFSDSKYVVDGTNKWLSNWVRKDWKTGEKKSVKNQDLWKKIVELKKKTGIHAQWIRGHNGHPQNEMCDSIANYCTINKCFLEKSFPNCAETLSTIQIKDYIVYSDPFPPIEIQQLNLPLTNRAGKLLMQSFFETVEPN